MGRVFLALDPNIDRKIALKVLAPLGESGARQEEQLRQRFVLEARAAGNLNHPGIVAVYDAATDPETGLAYIAMEWVRGQSLQECIEESGPLAASRVIAIGEQVAMALATAHRRGLIHRDIKPANILLDESGQAKVTDFGVAKFASMSLTVAGQLLGSPRYMSPEQVRNEPLDGRSDLFSLGVVLYECATGVVPFEGGSLASIAYKILEIDPKPPRSVNPSLSMALARVIERALAKAPQDRFQTGEEFARALRSEDANDVEAMQRARMRRSPVSGAGRTGTVVLDRRPWASFSKRARVFLTALAISSALLLVLMLRPRESELLPQGESPPAAREPQTVVSEARQSPVPAGRATLEVLYNNRLRTASMSIWIDGAEAWSRTVAGPKKFLKKAAGEDVRATVPVPEGRHTIEVRVSGGSGKVDAAQRVETVFLRGQTRRLRVVLTPLEGLRLRWKE
jgi:serine/threonine-protein kinase